MADEHPSLRQRVYDSPAGNIAVLVVVAALIVGGVWLVNWWTHRDDPPGGTSSVELAFDAKAVEVGQEAPDFTVTTLDGQTIQLSRLRGKPVWLLFGATWCPNCRAEAADVEAVWQNRSDDVAVIGVFVGETPGTVSEYVDRVGLTFPQVADTDTALGSAYRAIALPTHVLIDAGGVVRRIDVGGVGQSAANARIDEVAAY